MQSWLLLVCVAAICFFQADGFSFFFFFPLLAEDVPPSTLPPAQHIWWDIIWRKWRAYLNCESCCLLVKATTSSRESHPPDLVFPGKSRCFTGRKEKYREPWKWFWSSSRNFGAEREEDSKDILPDARTQRNVKNARRGRKKWHYSSNFAIIGGKKVA